MYHKTRQHLPSINDFISTQPLPNERRLLDYLFSGVVIEPMGGGECDIDIISRNSRIGPIVPGDYCPGDRYIGAGEILTDGYWYWHGFHLYYLKNYRLNLDPKFINYAAVNKWTIDRTLVDLSPLDI